MPIFPPARTFIVPPSQWHSRDASITMLAALANYPAENAVDGSRNLAARSAATSELVTVNIGATVDANIFGILHHSIDVGLVCGFSVGSLLRGAAARHPDFWLDLRDATGANVSGSVFEFFVDGNSVPISLAEVVVAEGFVFHGSLQAYPTEHYRFYQSRLTLEEGAIAISASGAAQRTAELALSLDGPEVDLLDQIFDEAGLTGERVLVVPDSRKNDVWLVDWPSTYEKRFVNTFSGNVEVSIALVEEAGGVV